MQLTRIDTIPSGLTMVERAEVYVDTAGTYYVAFTKSPGGADAEQTRYLSEAPIQLEAGDA